MKVLKIFVSPRGCINSVVELRGFTPNECLINAYGNEEIAAKNWDNYAYQQHDGYETISTSIGKTHVTYVIPSTPRS